MEPASRPSSEGRVVPGSAWLRRMSPLRDGRYALAAFAVVLAVLSVLTSHDAIAAVPDSHWWTVGTRVHSFSGISTAGKADGPHAALPMSVRQKQFPVHEDAVHLGPRGAGAPIYVEPGITASSQLLPAIVDADSTGAGRTPEEERTADAEGCALMRSGGRSGSLCIRHSRAPVRMDSEPLTATGAASDPRIASSSSSPPIND